MAGAEIAIALGPRASLGRILDAQRTLARADRAMARPWVFQSRVESTRSTLLRFNRALLDWSSIVQHLSRVLHRSVPTSLTLPADPVCGAACVDYGLVFCRVSTGRLDIALDASGAARGSGDYRLCLGHISLCRTTFRRALSLPIARRPCGGFSHQAHGSSLRADGRWAARFCGRYPRWRCCVSGSVD